MRLFYAGSGDVCPNHLSQENTHSRGQGSPQCISDPKVTGYTRPQGHSSGYVVPGTGPGNFTDLVSAEQTTLLGTCLPLGTLLE